jgi:hypothetical protein
LAIVSGTSWLPPSLARWAGEGKTVEVDETEMGNSRKTKRRAGHRRGDFMAPAFTGPLGGEGKTVGVDETEMCAGCYESDGASLGRSVGVDIDSERYRLGHAEHGEVVGHPSGAGIQVLGVRRGEAEGRNSDSEAKALIIKMKTDWRLDFRRLKVQS